MAVQAASLEVLEKAAVPPAQARAIVQAIEIEIAGAKDTLATKADLVVLRQEIGDVRHVLELKLETLRGELRSEMHSIAVSGLRHMYGAMLGQLAVLLGLAYFFVSHVQH